MSGDIPNREQSRSIQGEYEGVVVVDGQAYCPSVNSMPQLLDLRRASEAGEIAQEQFEAFIEQREALRLRTKQVNEDSSIRSPARR